MRIRHIIAAVLIVYFGYNLIIGLFVGLGEPQPEFVGWLHAPLTGAIWCLKQEGIGGGLLLVVVTAIVFGIIYMCCSAPAKVQPHPRHLGVPPIRR